MPAEAVSARPKIVGATPWLACADLLATIAFFESKLGFAKEWTWGDPPTDGGVQRDGIRLYLVQNPDLAVRAKDSEITITVENIDALYAEHRANGAPIEMTIRDEPWGAKGVPRPRPRWLHPALQRRTD
jgi:catechol 2,3-dioxygenase-like lactoylglutathione lyase family enzyme